MLTVDYNRLGLRPGDLLLDLGCGFGRHAFEAFRRGARVVACDLAQPELQQVRAIFEAMVDAGEAPPTGMADTTCADATRLPFPSATFDRIIASEVLEHIAHDIGALDELARVLKPGGTIAVTVPAWLAETICWTLSDEYYAPKAEGGHVRIYTESRLRSLLAGAGLEPGASHLAHALHTPYWWLKCLVGLRRDTFPLVKAYNRLLVWDIEKRPVITRLAERLLNPVLGKSLVVYATKPIAARASTAGHVRELESVRG
ncbi:MAG: class I SAM-dependent methyltransferase [Acidimicrobiales bacterium]|nr:class I SAM-dependent methyltransferase [Acidimicrobiales bacterium]